MPRPRELHQIFLLCFPSVLLVGVLTCALVRRNLAYPEVYTSTAPPQTIQEDAKTMQTLFALMKQNPNAHYYNVSWKGTSIPEHWDNSGFFVYSSNTSELKYNLGDSRMSEDVQTVQRWPLKISPRELEEAQAENFNCCVPKDLYRWMQKRHRANSKAQGK